ncbi:MAG: sensor histidine kinase N-terminal domain-containing protein [Piscinibacter sp.]|uniref:sensor histidine kinase n=1 Tax=Piscinibacter sp. TaxID=1903157 RepID=UPI0025902E27|nr:sensor histidine kinase [Piscinibacter sp.]MCW5664258.1 sensor histidine kinase N-terminal domain-containing protein [Piscinibacter sp.]
MNLRLSLRSQLLIGILVPVLLGVAINTASLYRQALRAADTAYDRTLLASAKSIGEQLAVVGRGDAAVLQANVPYSALEAFEADNRSRLYYKVSGFRGEMVSGFEDLPAWHGRIPAKGPYAALVDFYDERYRGEPVRMAVLLQPVAGPEGRGMATVQVAETLELRQTLARQILVDTLWRQAALLAVLTAVVLLVVQVATRPVRALSAQLRERAEDDLSPIEAGRAPRELQPLLDATNHVMGRLAQLLEHQKRFVRDTAHQLRTPLAVLKAQLQSARRGDVEPAQALAEVAHTVDRATELANQMLALAKVEQMRQQGDAPVSDWAVAARTVALDLGALIAQAALEFDIETVPAPIRSHDWALRELTRNLLHNAIRHAPPGSPLTLRLAARDGTAELRVEDRGPGLSAEQQARLFQPFAAGRGGGTGLGLAICHEIVRTLGGSIALVNREGGGLAAVVRLPLAQNPAP